MKPWKRWQDWTNLVLGTWLLLVPAIAGLSGNAATLAYLVGAAVGVVSVWALRMPASYAAEWCNVLLGAFYFLSPWLFGFAGVPDGARHAWAVGLAVATLASAALPKEAEEEGVKHAPAH